ncbi:NUDIX domain-containing protein [Mucilaginibacter sp. BJC16-A38]|uniref:NUDIX hydrolase n=1 Tax=Mucilaginibacter phenanthrenivorans TaxID=1234842 RepID=UPI0021575A14|nr:NUDIX domain-containing protein [Mucilaginibacter phenanthrenivorans]MCR8560736.1 NUDIX domain-containing protein [Mucilaginibacter phenanthrenivorans]
MLTKKELKDYCDKARENFLPHISIDCVVFGFHEGLLKVLLLKVKNEGEWYLPGGFMLKAEPIEKAADRILKERTGLDKIFLQQFQVFGDPERSKEHFEMYKDMLPAKENWFTNRFLTIGYYALVDFCDVTPAPDQFSATCAWRDLNDLPELKLDHALILKTALDTLRLQLNYQPIGYNLMPKEFTMPELQKLYETILDKKLDRRNFQRRMLGFGILNRSEKPRKGGAHKAPYLYSFDLENYQAALTEGFKGGW